MSQLLMTYVPCPSKETAESIVTELLVKKVIACGNVYSASSLYIWEDQLQNENEWAILAKSTIDQKLSIQELLEIIHPYEIPAIIQWSVECNEKYYNWVVGRCEDYEIF